jgi:hypothetical protein
MGSIIFWGIIRTAVLIPILWLGVNYLEFQYWWLLITMAVYGVIIHPAIIQYQRFLEQNKEVILDTLCSSCKYFEETAVLCTKLDVHPTRETIPCDGHEWEPK